MPISVACSCGVRLKTKDENAGRSLKCPKCGNPIRVPAASASATAQPKAAEAAPADIYGLDDEPVSRSSEGSDGIYASSPSSSSSAATEEKLPPRAGYTPMTDAKKKKIAKRAAKVDKEKPSFAGAGIGVSFGTVLLIAFIGWRIYRVGRTVHRVVNAVNASAAADPKADAKEMDQEIEADIKKANSAEAREWLDAAKHPNHGVFEMGNERAREMVNGFYERGAEAVYVIDPDTIEQTVVASVFAVKLPADPAKRKECLAWEVQFLEGEEPTQDVGQKYLMITTD